MQKDTKVFPITKQWQRRQATIATVFTGVQLDNLIGALIAARYKFGSAAIVTWRNDPNDEGYRTIVRDAGKTRSDAIDIHIRAKTIVPALPKQERRKAALKSWRTIRANKAEA
jgi:hypothetical protein